MRIPLLVGISILWVPLAFLFDGVTVLLLPVRLVAAGGGAAEIGLVSFGGLALAMLIQPLAGRLSDRLRERVDRRRFMALAAVPALGGLWLLAGPTALPLAVIGYVVLQVSASALQAAQQALIPEHVRAASAGRAAGLKGAFDVGGAFLAFLVLGALLAAGEIVPAAVVISVLLAGAVLLVRLLVPPSGIGVPAVAAAPRRALSAVPPGFGRLIAARFLFLLGVYAIGRFMLLLVADRLNLDPAQAAGQAGGLLALFTLVTAVAALPAGWLADVRGRQGMMAIGAALTGLGILGFVPAAGIGGVVAAGLAMALGTATFMAANWAATTDLAPAADAGRLMGLANVGTAGAAACAGLLGPLIEVAGFTPAIVLAAAATVAAVVPLAGRSRLPALEEAT